MHRIVRFAPLALVGCLGDDIAVESDACDLAAENDACPECSSGPTTCTFGDTSVTANSCGDCQARAALYSTLCDDGDDASRAQIEAETVCEPTACEVWYDGCTDACQPLCVFVSEIPETTCDMGCSTLIPPPGECVSTGFTCEWAP